MCFPFSLGKRETHKQFDPHPFPGQSREVVYVYWFFSPPIWGGGLPRKQGWEGQEITVSSGRTLQAPSHRAPGGHGISINIRENSSEFQVLVSDILFPLQTPTPPHPDKPPRPSHPRGLDFGPFRLRLAPFGSVWLRLAPFRVCSGSVSVGSVRGASVREKNITSLGGNFGRKRNI